MKLKTILTFLMIVILTSCGSKKGDTTSAALSLGFGTLGDSALVDGGIMIYGWADHGDRFGFRYENQVVELKNGNWEFAALAWDDQALSGTLRCAYLSGTQLTGGQTTVNLTLNQNNCKNPVFGGDDVRNQATGVPFPLKFRTCGNDTCLMNESGPYETPLRGVAQSFKVMLVGQDNAGNPTLANGVEGPCNNHDVNSQPQPDHVLTSNTGTPTGDTILPILNLPIPTVVRAYDNTNCAGGFEEFIFENGVRGFSPDKSFFQTDGSSNNILSLKSNICRTSATPSNLSGLNLRFWAAADGGSGTPATNYVCTAAHFKEVGEKVNDGTIDTHTIVLGKNIDASLDSGYTTIGTAGSPFTGEFIGNGYQISNFSMTNTGGYLGIFGKVTGTIEELNLKSISITNSSSAGVGHFGALAGQVADGAEIRDIYGEDITIDITSCTSACENVGGMIGAIRSGSGDAEVYGIDAYDVHIKTHDGVTNVGGLVGQVGDTADSNHAALRSSSIDQVILEHTITTTNQGENFGGVAGKVEAELWDVIATRINIGGYTDATEATEYDFFPSQNVGGIAGKVSGTSSNVGRISYAKSSGVINTEDTNAVGGVIGFVENSRGIEDLISNIDIDAFSTSPSTVGNKIGGVIGAIGSASTSNMIQLRRIRNYGDILDCANDCGGVIGYIDDSGDGVQIENAHNYGNIGEFGVTPVNAGDVGGIVGFYSGTQASTVIQYAHNEGDIYASGTTGGIIGTRSASQGTLQIHYAYNLGDIHTDSATLTDAAGLVGDLGQINDGDISNLYNIGDIQYDISGTATAGMADFGTASEGDTLPTAATTLCDAIGGSIHSSLTNTLCSTISDPSNFSDYTQVSSNSSEWIDFGDGTPALFNWRAMQTLEDPTDGTLGSTQDPIVIDTTAKWNTIKDNPVLMSRAFILGANLDFTSKTFFPIGSSTHPFTGRFNGNNYTIRDVTRNETSGGDHLGIFRVIGEEGYCENNSYTNYTDCNTNSSTWRVRSSAQIGNWDDHDYENRKKLYLENIDFSSDQSAKAVGILAGKVIDDESSDSRGVEIEAVEVINGFVGSIGATGAAQIGGVIGDMVVNNSVELESLTSSAKIINDECGVQHTGGIIGRIMASMSSNLRIDGLQYSGRIDCLTGADNTGGVIGYINNTGGGIVQIERATNTANITAAQKTGGIVGTINSNKVEVIASFSKGAISGTTDVGGLAGSAAASSIIKASYAQGSVSGTLSAGGLVGNCVSGCKVHNSYSNVVLTATTVNPILVGTPHVDFDTPGESNNYYISLTTNATADGYATKVLPTNKNNPANMSNLANGLSDPFWFHFFGDSPRLYFEILPPELLD